MSQFKIRWTQQALKMLKKVGDRQAQKKIVERAEGLADDPEKQGKALGGELSGFRSVRAVNQRYRIIYKIERQQVIVYVLAVGIRKQDDRRDIYTLAKKLILLKLDVS